MGAARVGVDGHRWQARRSVRYCCSPPPSVPPPPPPPSLSHTHTLGLSTPGRARSDQFTAAAIWWKRVRSGVAVGGGGGGGAKVKRSD